MIPMSDVSHRPLNFPIMMVLIIAANAVMFLIEMALVDGFINRWS